MVREEIEPKNKPVRLGIIGLGSIGSVHVDALNSATKKDFSLTAVSDLQPQQIAGVDFFPDYKELLQNPDIQAISINTPPNTHYQMVMDSLKAGKHVLVEKPPALTVVECEEMIQLARRKNKVLFMAFHARYHPEVDAAAEELRGKQIKEINIRYSEWVLNYHDPKGWIFDPAIAGGGVLMDSGINALSIVTKVMPNIRINVVKAEFSKPSDFQVETKADVEFSFGPGEFGRLSMDWMQKGPEIRQVIFYTDKDDQYNIDIVKNRLSKNGVVLSGSKSDSRALVDQRSEYRGVYEDFANHLSTNTSLVSTQELEFVKEAYKRL